MTTKHTCHWCNREVDPKDLIFVNEDYYYPDVEVRIRPGEGEPEPGEQGWHQFCFAIIHGLGE